MMSLQSGDVIWVEFPFVEVDEVKARPALVISDRQIGPDQSLVWTLMITNAQRADWPGDVPIEMLDIAGLPHPSKVRTAKVTTSMVRDARPLGKLSAADHARVWEELKCVLPPLSR